MPNGTLPRFGPGRGRPGPWASFGRFYGQNDHPGSSGLHQFPGLILRRGRDGEDHRPVLGPGHPGLTSWDQGLDHPLLRGGRAVFHRSYPLSSSRIGGPSCCRGNSSQDLIRAEPFARTRPVPFGTATDCRLPRFAPLRRRRRGFTKPSYVFCGWQKLAGRQIESSCSVASVVVVQ